MMLDLLNDLLPYVFQVDMRLPNGFITSLTGSDEIKRALMALLEHPAKFEGYPFASSITGDDGQCSMRAFFRRPITFQGGEDSSCHTLLDSLPQ